MQNLKKFVQNNFSKFILIVLLIIVTAGLIILTMLNFSLPVMLSKEIVVSTYTLAVTIVLAVAAFAGGGIIWIIFSFRREIESQHEKMGSLVKDAERAKEEVIQINKIIKNLYNDLYTKREIIIKILNELQWPNLTVGLSLANKIETSKVSAKQLARIFRYHSLLLAQATRLFTATEPKAVKAAAMAISQLMPNNDGKALIEKRLELEQTLYPNDRNTELIEFLARLLGSWR